MYEAASASDVLSEDLSEDSPLPPAPPQATRDAISGGAAAAEGGAESGTGGAPVEKEAVPVADDFDEVCCIGVLCWPSKCEDRRVFTCEDRRVLLGPQADLAFLFAFNFFFFFIALFSTVYSLLLCGA